MAKLKITFKKEVWADLNAYYPSFPPVLRKAIDNAIYRLLGGKETAAPTPNRDREKTGPATGVSQAVILKRTPKECSRPYSKVGTLLKDYKVGSEYLKDDVHKKATTEKGMAGVSVHALVRDGYFEVVK